MGLGIWGFWGVGGSGVRGLGLNPLNANPHEETGNRLNEQVGIGFCTVRL